MLDKPEYLLMIQYKIDFKINQLCSEAMRFCDDVGRINFEIFSNFKTITNAIDDSSLTLYHMPRFIRKLKQEELEGQGESKRRKILGDTDTSTLCLPVKNEKPHEKWTLKPNEKFTNFLHSNKKPKLCLKFWLKNKCNSDCKFKFSHRDTLNAKQSRVMNDFVSEVRRTKGGDTE